MARIKTTIMVLILFSYSYAYSIQEADKSRLSIGKRIELFSEKFGEKREIWISLPDQYEEHLQSYPVIFVMDADMLSMFELTRATTNLMTKEGFMPESIIVGLTNNGNHNNRYQMTSGEKRGSGFYENKAADYVHFLRYTLIPYMENNYRCAPHRTIMGLSPSNGPVYESFYSAPNLFNAYIFLAADLYFRYSETKSRGAKLIESMRDKSHPPASVYFGMSSEDVDWDSKHAEQFNTYKKLLKEDGAGHISYLFDIIENSGHYEMAAVGLRNAFRHIYSKWNKIRAFHRFKNPVTDIEKHYKKLSARFGYSIYPLEEKIHFFARSWMRWSKTGEADDFDLVFKILDMGIKFYPNSSKLHLLLAEANKFKGNTKKARKMLKRSIDLAKRYPVKKEYKWFNEKVNELNKIN